jgi:MerR family transcriptional regulator, copper efflux regulator
MTKTAEKLMRVGELAKVVGKTVRAMHLYEELGLLRPVSRSAGGYRLYTDEAASRVKWITRMQELGFSLPEVQSFLKNWESSDNGPAGMYRVRAVFDAKLSETRAQIARLKDLERELQASLAYLDLCGRCEPIHKQNECGCCEQPGHDPATAPELVAGLAKSHTQFDVPVGHLMTTALSTEGQES